MSIRPVIDSTLPTIQRDACATGSADPCAGFFGADGGSFKTVLDIINPLQQIPIVSTIYRAVTGDTISPGARLAGGAIYGGPLGFLGGLVNAIAEGATGQDIGASIVSQLTGKGGTEVADNSASQYDYVPAGLRSANNAYVSAQNLIA